MVQSISLIQLPNSRCAWLRQEFRSGFDGGSRDDEPVKPFLPHIALGPVERHLVLGGGIPRDVVGHPNEEQLDLKRARSEQADDLRLGADLARHQVEQVDPQWPDV